MPRYSYIQVVLSEQSGHAVTTLLHYTAAGAPDLTGVPTAAAVFDYFLNARECIVQRITPEGACFVLMFRDPYAVGRDSYYMLTLRVVAGGSLTGRETYRVLTALRKALVDERRMSPDAVEQTLAECGVPDQARGCESWRLPSGMRHREGALPCYRSYMSAHELETFLTFPVQKEYADYSAVIYVPATTSLRPGVELTQITAPVHVVYTIDLPAGIEASRPAVAAGERVVLTFNRTGYSPVRETVVAGRPSPYVSYSGARMVVKDLSECQLSFTRRIPFTVRSSKGGPVTGYTVTVNGRPVNTMQPYIEISDQDLRDGMPVTIVVSSNNFVTDKLELHPSQLDPSRPISVVLHPLEQGITLRLDFGEGRMFETQISIERNTPEYSQLRGGAFHGFHARRLTVPGGGEIYYVDVRSGQRPMAPEFDNVSAEQKPEPPRFDRSLPTVETDDAESGSDTGDDGAERTTPHRRTYRRKNLTGMIVTIVALLIAVGAGIWWLVPKLTGPSSPEVAPSDSIPAAVADTLRPTPAPAPDDTPAQPQETAQPVEAAPQSAAGIDAADVRYLNSTDVWHRDSLRSEQGIALYDDLIAGRIEMVVRNPYFTTAGLATNSRATRLADLLWACFGSSTQRSNEKELLKLSGRQSVDIRALYEKLAHYRSPEPNKTPRPRTTN